MHWLDIEMWEMKLLEERFPCNSIPSNGLDYSPDISKSNAKALTLRLNPFFVDSEGARLSGVGFFEIKV